MALPDALGAYGRIRLPDPLPLVGRTEELSRLEALLDDVGSETTLVFLAGEGGVGKSRLADEFAARAATHDRVVARGRAYPVESGVPYALLSDAFLPLLRKMDPETLTVLSRGGEAELRYLFPALSTGGRGALPSSGGEPEEFRTRLQWNFAELIKNFSARTPLLVILEDLQWADDSSLQLLHFLARQAAGQSLFFLCTYNESERQRASRLAQIERSLASLGLAEVRFLDPLTREQVTGLLRGAFDVDADRVREFSHLLHGWTRGNPFFIEEILRSLVSSGRLTARRGTWVGWDVRHFDVPSSIRGAVLSSMGTFSNDTRRVAELAAIIGTRASYPLLSAISGLSESDLLVSLDELCARGVLLEDTQDGAVVYDFVHPIVRRTLYDEFGLQRTRVLHGAVAEAMEGFWRSDAEAHADELAYHFARTDAQRHKAKAVRYLTAAGRNALERHADREAANYLKAALERCPDEPSGRAQPSWIELSGLLARAYLRLGEYGSAVELWSSLLERVEPGTALAAKVHRSVGLALFWDGDEAGALDHLDQGLAVAESVGARQEIVRLRLARSHCLQELGRGEEALREIVTALPAAEAVADVALLARVHRSLALLHVWIGPPREAHAHAERGIELARACGDVSVEFWCQWALAVLTGLKGKLDQVAEGYREASALAERLRSPVLRLWTEELGVELAYATGDWEEGIVLGERSISLARDLNQRMLLPRLLVWTALFYVGRGQHERAKALVDEACDAAGMNRPEVPVDVHLVVPAHIGLAHYLVGTGQYHEAIRVARRGLEIAEGTGYVLWAMHRLLPILAEACLWAGEIDQAAEVGQRMRAHARALDHKLGMAWADACDALVRWKRGDPERGAVLMRGAAEALEAIPMIPYATRIRRQLAGRLAEIGDREGALRELHRVHDIFVSLGAELELDKTRVQFREVGQRPPPRGVGEGWSGLTPREMEIARLVAARKSNKGIGKELGISPRTVSTHLSNIFRKIEVSSRGELADFMRSEGLLDH